MKQAKIYVHNRLVGILSEDESGYTFVYETSYLEQPEAEPISLTMPLQETPFFDKALFPFFDGLIPEGWLLDVAENTWKINGRDRMSLLLACCKDCIGAVSVVSMEELL